MYKGSENLGPWLVDDREARNDLIDWAMEEFGDVVSRENVFAAVHYLLRHKRYNCTAGDFIRQIQEVLYDGGFDVPFNVGSYVRRTK